MSGIAGIARLSASGVSATVLGRMAAAIKHRGPHGFGFYAGNRIGLAHVRLATLEGDDRGQPLTNEDGRILLTASCEIFNHPELRHELEQRGHIFRTRCHAEVLVHGYEEWGPGVLQRLDGQFAFAICDKNRGTLFVARDRFGIRPLYYAQRNGDFYFASEIKGILATGEVDAALDPRGLDEVLRLGAARPPRTVFSGIASLEPGTYGTWRDGALWLQHYYELDFPELTEEPADVVERLDEIMLRSVGMRSRASVPLGAYISGGLDSAITASLTRSAYPQRLQSFSITSAVSEYDESVHQHEVAAGVGSEHRVAVVDLETIARTLPEVLWHAETPLLETRPVFMFHLARLAKDSGVRALVGGEGADELFLGNPVFRESSVRRFCLRHDDSLARRRLFERITADAPRHAIEGEELARLIHCASAADPLFSHLPRFLTSGLRDVYDPSFQAALAGIDVVAELRASLPTRFFAWSALNQAAYLELTTRFSPAVLSSHADRMTAAHGLDARYPFLDHRVFEFVAALPTGSRLRGLRDKEILRRWASRALPRQVAAVRPRRADAPDVRAFLLPKPPVWIGDHMSPEALRRVGIFSAAGVERLVSRCTADPSAVESRMLIGVMSTQLWHHQFVDSVYHVAPLRATESSTFIDDEGAPTAWSSASMHADTRN